MKEMVIKIPLTNSDTKRNVEELILVALREFGDMFYAIDEVLVDEEKVFGTKDPNGFNKEFFRKEDI